MPHAQVSKLKSDINKAEIPNRTIALVGLMGAGKSTVGRRLADRIGRCFYDSDHEIEKAAGLKITDIFSDLGEAEFRRGEEKVISRLLAGRPHVLATGGGAFMNPRTRSLMRKSAITVWLDADLETLWKRVSKRRNRPLLNRKDAKSVLRDLLKERAPIYQQADLRVQSLDGPHKRTVEAILTALQERV